MKNKAVGRIIAISLSVVMAVTLAPLSAVAEDVGNVAVEIIEDDIFMSTSETSDVDENQKSYTVCGFKERDVMADAIYIDADNRPSLEALTAMMPKELTVSVWDNNSENLQTVSTVNASVSWECVGENYEDAEGYYYQFSPAINGYEVDESIDIIKDAPYIPVFVVCDDGAKLNQGTSQLMAVTKSANEKKVYDFIVGTMKLNSAAACGIMANIQYESSFNPNALGDKGTSYGICQWHASRWDNLKNYCSKYGYDSTTLEGQLHFLEYELKNSYRTKVYNKLVSVENSADGAYDAAYCWCYYFEVPANKETVAVTRGNVARDKYWKEYGNSSSGGESGQEPVAPQPDYTTPSDIVFNDNWGDNIYYMGCKLTPSVVVMREGKTLTPKTDYTITFSNNQNATINPKNPAKYTITYKGEYKKVKRDVRTFTIKQGYMREADVYCGDMINYTRPGIYKSKVYINYYGLVLKASDYTVSYWLDLNHTIPMDSKHKLEIPEGDESATVYVKVTGKDKNMTGEIYGQYTVYRKPAKDDSRVNIASCILKLDDTTRKGLTFTGDTFTIGDPIDLKLYQNSGAVKSGTPVDESYYKINLIGNVRKGTAVILVNGYGSDAIGSKAITFRIK